MAEYTQDKRPLRVNSPLGKDVLLLRSFAGTEGVSRPFSFTVDVLATRSVKAEELLEKPVTIEVDSHAGKEPRVIHGLVTGLTTLARDQDLYAYRMDLAPWIWLLSLTRDCRIFQEKTALEIVEQVFSDRGFSDFRVDCTGDFRKREFCVQYRESDFDFVSRLLEDEGVYYFFEHESNKHTLVLADHPGAVKTCPGQGEVRLLSAGIPGVEEGVITFFSKRTTVHTGKTALNDYNFEDPSGDLLATVIGQGVGEDYDYPGGYRLRADATRLTEIRLEAKEASRELLHGSGNSSSLIPGYRFSLKDAGEGNGDYFLLEVQHEGSAGGFRSGQQGESSYSNNFSAIPFETPYRPPHHTPTPAVHGLQTAVVVGPSGEEIYTDKYGRVKVRFHWDRESPKPGDDTSSCWIRVATTWAGNKWGAIQIPRVGQEVVVEFLEGNPDRPLVTGGVYNAKMMPPFGASPTQSGLITRTSKDGSTDLANELRFEDKKGEEEIFLHAEKDLTVEVENDSKLTVENDRWITIEHDRILKVRNDDTVEVLNDQAVDVKNDQKVGVAGNRTLEVANNYDVSVSSNYSNDVSNAYKLSATSIELKCGGNSIKIDQAGITITGTKVSIEGKTMGEFKASMIKIEGKAMAELKAAMTQVKGDSLLMAKGGITLVG